MSLKKSYKIIYENNYYSLYDFKNYPLVKAQSLEKCVEVQTKLFLENEQNIKNKIIEEQNKKEISKIQEDKEIEILKQIKRRI